MAVGTKRGRRAGSPRNHACHSSNQSTKPFTFTLHNIHTYTPSLRCVIWSLAIYGVIAYFQRQDDEAAAAGQPAPDGR